MGFFSNILNKVSRWFNWGRYREILLFSDKLLKKYLTILSSSEWKVTTAKTPSFFKIFDADIKPFSSSLISWFTKILSAWKILVALCILKFFFLLVFSISLTNPCVSISFFLREMRFCVQKSRMPPTYLRRLPQLLRTSRRSPKETNRGNGF